MSQCSLSSFHYGYVEKYADLAGMSSKAVVEYLIERHLLPELIQYQDVEPVPEYESDRLAGQAQRMLPSDWTIHIQDAFMPPAEITIMVHFGIGGPSDFVEIRSDALETFCSELETVAEHGGMAFLGSDKRRANRESIVARRHGRGITFMQEGDAGSRKMGARTSIPTRMVSSVVAGFRKAVEAAHAAEEERHG